MNFLQFLMNDISLPVIIGMFTYRLLSSLLNDIIIPIIDILLHEHTFYQYNLGLGEDNEIILTDPVDMKNALKNRIGFGIFLRELIIWLVVMFIFYIIFVISQK